MFSLYFVLKFIHILSAIVAVGANITYGVWNAFGAREPAHLGFALKGIRFLDDRIANPAYGVLLITGLLMVFVGNLSITALWIVVALILFVVVAVLGFAVYTPLLRNQIRMVEAGQTTSPEFARLSRRSTMLGPVIGILVVLVLVMMVFKPHL
jgi:uncharacterized membrane protein